MVQQNSSMVQLFGELVQQIEGLVRVYCVLVSDQVYVSKGLQL